MTSRRDFLQRSALAAAGLSLSPDGRAGRGAAGVQARTRPSPGFLDLGRQPDSVIVETAAGYAPLRAGSGERWEGAGVLVSVAESPDALRVALAAPAVAVMRCTSAGAATLDGRAPAPRATRGSAGYGDLEWRGFVPDRVMPWYFAAWDGERTHGYGVRTGAAAFCFWQVDPDGISLWADVRSGGVGRAARRRACSTVCDVVSPPGTSGETPFAAIHAFCQRDVPEPRGCPRSPVYGSNDWYWAYGNNSAASVLARRARAWWSCRRRTRTARSRSSTTAGSPSGARQGRAWACGTAATRGSPTCPAWPRDVRGCRRAPRHLDPPAAGARRRARRVAPAREQRTVLDPDGARGRSRRSPTTSAACAGGASSSSSTTTPRSTSSGAGASRWARP